MKNIVIHTDGGARGNPGPAGIGAVIADKEGAILKEVSEYIGETTNNVAEYTAVLRACEEVKKLFPGEHVSIDFYIDSQLVERQLNGEYKVKDSKLKPLAERIQSLQKTFGNVTFSHIRREQNKEADRLANDAMDEGSNKGA